MEYDVLFPSILVISLLLGLIADGSLFATLSVALPWDCSFPSRVFSSIPFSLSAWLKNNCFSSLTSEDVVVTSMGVVCTSSRILRQIFYVALSSSQARSSAAVLTEPTLSAMLKLNCNKYLYALPSDGRTAFVRLKCVTDMLSVKTIVGFAISQKTCANLRNAM